MDKKQNTTFLGVALQGQTYMNILFLLFSFPLGIFYFVFFITGLSMGVGMLPIFIGIFVLLFTFFAAKLFMGFERAMTRSFLGIDIDYPKKKLPDSVGFWSWAKAGLTDLHAWKGLLFLLLKFPLGIFNFVCTVTLLSISLSLTGAPIAQQAVEQSTGIDIFQNDLFSLIAGDAMGSFEKAITYAVIGIPVFFLSLHGMNLLARLQGKLIAGISKEW